MTKARIQALFDSIVPDPNHIVFRGGLYSSLEFLRTGATTSGKYLLAKVTVPPGAGPGPHIHHWTDEWFYTPDGGAVVFKGTKEYKDGDAPPDKSGRDSVTLVPLEEGGLFYGPRHYIHGYINASHRPIVVYVVWRPDTPDVSVLDFFFDVSKPVFLSDRLNSHPSLDIQTVREITVARKYGMNFSSSFWEYIKETHDGRYDEDNQAQELEELIGQGAQIRQRSMGTQP